MNGETKHNPLSTKADISNLLIYYTIIIFTVWCHSLLYNKNYKLKYIELFYTGREKTIEDMFPLLKIRDKDFF